MDFSMTLLNERLLLIRWYNTPGQHAPAHRQFLKQLKHHLDTASNPLYLISDLRFGFVRDSDTLKSINRLCKHPNFAGSTAFSQNPVASLSVNATAHACKARHTHSHLMQSSDEALAFLEKQAPGITSGISARHLDSVLV